LRVAFVASLHAPVTDISSDGDHTLMTDLARGLAGRGHEVMVFGAQGSFLRDVATTPLCMGRGYEQLLWHVEQWRPDVISQHAADPDALAVRAFPAVHTLHANPDGIPVIAAVHAAAGPRVAVSRDSLRRWRATGALGLRFIARGLPEIPARGEAPEEIALVPGRIARERGTADAIRAAKSAGLRPMLVGDVADRSYFAREVVPLLAGVRISGVLSRERIWALMARSAVTVLPLHTGTAFSLAAAEAQAAGCPVVAYRTPLMAELVPDDGGVLVDEGDSGALAGGIAAARTLDPDRVRASALARFERAAMIDAHEKLLASAATGAALPKAA
jgi:glycosyltransferase involved in cell wall biosynthesis